jgi:hypothetical protein
VTHEFVAQMSENDHCNCKDDDLVKELEVRLKRWRHVEDEHKGTFLLICDVINSLDCHHKVKKLEDEIDGTNIFSYS